MPLGVNHSTATVHRGRLYVHGGYAGRGLSEPTAALLEYDPRRNRWRRLRSSPDRARRARRGRGRRPPLRGRRRRRVAVAPVARGVRLPHAALAPRPELPRAGAQPHDRRGRRRPLLRARPAATTRTSRWPSATTRAKRRWERLPDLRVARGGIASALVSGGRIVVFGGENLEPGGTTIAPVELFDIRTRRWRRLPDMLTPRHGLGGAALGDRVYAIEGGPAAGLPLLAGDRVPGRALSVVPAQGRHPHRSASRS